jgi:purine nucleosidase
MKRLYLFLVFFFLLINLQGQSTKVIIDADTGNEIDDLPAIVLALKSAKLDVLALTAAQWNRFGVCGRQTMHESWLLNNQILNHLDLLRIPSLKGAEYEVTQHWQNRMTSSPNSASDFIIKKALEVPDGEKLKVIVTGSATNVASAILLEPRIINKIAIYFIGTIYDFDRNAFNKNEFNVRSDLNAVDVLLNADNLELYIMPANICTQLIISQTDLDTKINSKDGIHGMLKERWNEINKKGLDWIMWDIAIIQAVMNPQWTKQVIHQTPPENTPRNIFLYTEIDTEAMLNDFWKIFLK